MTVAVLISGSLFRAPEQRTSQASRRFVSATIKVGGENRDAEFWSALAFGTTAGEELMRLAVGERLAVQGGLKIETYVANDGTTKISRTIFCDHVMALRQPPKERKPKATREPATAGPPSSDVEGPTERAPSSFYDDDIPF